MDLSHAGATVIGSRRGTVGPWLAQVFFPERFDDLSVQASIAARCATGKPGYFIDLDRFARRCAAAVTVAGQYDVSLLYAVKSFTHQQVLQTAATAGLGFDVSNLEEFGIVARSVAGARPFISLTSPGLPQANREDINQMVRAGAIDRLYCDSLGQLADLCSRLPGSDVGIRVNVNGETLPEEVTIYRPSRFGVRLRELPEARAIAASHGCRLRWLHLHNASEISAVSNFLVAGRLIMQRAREAGIEPASVDLGGGMFEQADEASLGWFFAALRNAIPAGVELFLEPGQFWMRDCGYLSTQVIDIKPGEDHIVLVTDCGTLNHLQWSRPVLPALGCLGGDARPYLVCGRTCFEHDVIGRVEPSPGHPAPVPGSWLVLGDVGGYSVELGCSFNGVPPSEPVVLADGRD